MQSNNIFSGAWGAAKSNFILKHADHFCTCVIAPNQKQAEFICNELIFFNTGKREILFFPEYDHPAFDEVRTAPELSHLRSKALYSLLTSQTPLIVVTTPYAFIKKLPEARTFLNNVITLSAGEIIERDDVAIILERLGYFPVEAVTGAGEFCIRGGMVDLFPADREYPVRIEFFDDEIEDIFEYSLSTQKRVESFPELKLLPLSEVLFTAAELGGMDLRDDLIYKFENFGKFAGHHWYTSLIYKDAHAVTGYLPDDTKFITVEETWLNLFERVLVSVKDLSSDIRHPMPMDEFYSLTELKKYFAVKAVDVVVETSVEESTPLRYRSVSSRFSFDKGNLYYALTEALNQIEKLHQEGFRTVIAMESKKFIDLLSDFCRDHEIPLKVVENMKEVKHLNLYLYEQRISGGFIDEKAKIAIITDEEIFGFIRRRHKPKQKEAFNTSIADLQEGDFVVHIDYGIGVYRGLKHMQMGGVEGDYLDILYDNNETLYVPLEQISQIQKYIGINDAKPRLSSLQSTNWAKLKSSARKQAKKIAQDLLKLYAERKAKEGFAFRDDGELLSDFGERFIYDETEDQLAAIMDVYKDMESSHPMERLICGDVGFGKTEVAMRAAYKAVISGKQVAVLVPTTVLCLQHFKTFTERFSGLPVRIDNLSRIRTHREIKSVKERLSAGDIDILIGTHRMLSNDIIFKDLRLLVIDEEQRFGVAHKEKIAAMRTNIDVLALSATPIPRTLQLSLSGIREISVIETPPSNRLPVSVKVISDADGIKKAMRKELERHGQIFYLHNRVKDLAEVVGYVQSLVPGARIASAHGQLKPKELEKILEDFYSGEIDILVSTTIIENGVDIPNVNAIFVDRASHFGLAQLYQLKGRVGRSGLKGYCYLIVDNMAGLTPIAKKRLSIIQQLSDLGSGLKIAMYDLQLRGAGDILGAAQSGFVTKVGYELFVRMIAEAVAELKDGGAVKYETEIVTQFPYYISADYIEDPRTRLDYYREFSSVESKYELEEQLFMLSKEYGEVKRETINLAYIMLIKNLCRELKITKAGIYPKMLRLTFAANSEVNLKDLTALLGRYDLHYRFAGEYELVIAFPTELGTMETGASLLADYLGAGTGVAAN